MAPIVESIEIARRPEEVFPYVTDPSHLQEWQESVVSVRPLDDQASGERSRFVVTRRIGRRELPMAVELTRDPPRSWTVRGLDGPVRGMVKGTVDPVGDGDRSRVSITLDFENYGIGKLLFPLVVRPRVRAEMPKNLRRLKELLESNAEG